jgi:hypothetical protein
VGEVGWPGTRAWNAVAATWYRTADADRLWVTAWSAAQWWPPGYPLAIYRLTPGGGRAGAQAEVLQAYGGSGRTGRGIDLPSGAFSTAVDGDSTYSNADPGRYGADYVFDTAANYRYLAAHGTRLVRVSVSWERLQPQLGGPLAPAEVARLTATLRAAAGAGVGVIVDLHNFGGYWAAQPALGGGPQRLVLGSPQLPTADLADLWRRLALELRGVPGVTGYDLMNEPGQLSRSAREGAAIWEAASQQAVTAIRATGDRHLVAVEGYGGSAPERFVELHPNAWIHDPAHAVRYEIHQYFDSDGSGHYNSSFAQETEAAAAAQPKGARRCAAAVADRRAGTEPVPGGPDGGTS